MREPITPGEEQYKRNFIDAVIAFDLRRAGGKVTREPSMRSTSSIRVTIAIGAVCWFMRPARTFNSDRHRSTTPGSLTATGAAGLGI